VRGALSRRIAAALAVAAVGLLTPSRAGAGGKGCVEVSDIVGQQNCSRYGDAWSIERRFPVTFRFGLRYGEFSTAGTKFKESFKEKHRPKGYVGYRFPGEALGVDTLSGLGADGGLAFFVVGQLYTGIEGGLLLGATRTATFTTGPHQLSDDSGVDVTLAHGGIPVGYRIPLGRASLRGEVLFGGVIAGVSQKAALDGETKEKSAAAFRGLIEPRIAGDIWFTQHMSFGVYAGVNMLDAGGRVLGLSLTWHNRAFDGDMSMW
jgi:hypothetical protein